MLCWILLAFVLALAWLLCFAMVMLTMKAPLRHCLCIFFLIVYTEDVLFCFGLPILTNSSLCYFPDNNDHEKREPVSSKSMDSLFCVFTPLAVSDLV